MYIPTSYNSQLQYGECILHWSDGTVKEFIVFTAFLEKLLFVKM